MIITEHLEKQNSDFLKTEFSFCKIRTLVLNKCFCCQINSKVPFSSLQSSIKLYPDKTATFYEVRVTCSIKVKAIKPLDEQVFRGR